MKNIIYALIVLALLSSSCENGDWEFEDFEYQSVYFAHQYPVRTITLGEDIFDTSMDNEWRFKIMATTGGVYENNKDVAIDVQVSNELLNGLVFTGSGQPIVAMPGNYYSMESQRIIIPEGEITGGVEVQLTDDFFADPLSIETTYVIPLRMTAVQNADSILSGEPIVENPNPAVSGDWAVQPKDYVFYAVKYINPWHGYYLRRGVDEITKDGVSTTEVRHNQYVEDDEVWQLSTLAFEEVRFPLDHQNKEGQNLNLDMKLVFDENNQVTVAPINSAYQVNDSVRVYNFSATGAGRFVEDGEKKSWGNQDRDGLYLSYAVEYEVEINYVSEGRLDIEQVQYNTTDTLVMRNRGVVMELFEPVVE